MKIGLSTSLHLDHSAYSLDGSPGETPTMQAFVPVGLLSLKAVVDRAGLDVDTRVVEINGLINNGTIKNNNSFYDNIVDAIWDEDHLIGLMTDADSLAHTILIAQHIKRRFPDTLICLGGPATSPIGHAILKTFSSIDFVIAGEAEITFTELIETLKKGEQPWKVRGMFWRDRGRVRFNGERAIIEDLDSLPIPAFDAYDMASGAPVYLDVGRGCPFQCHFCATAPFWKRRYRMKSINRIIKEMTLLRDCYERDHLNFSHDIFTCDEKWILNFCEHLVEADLGVTWTCSTRTDIIKPSVLEQMAKAGCVEIYYGIETGSRLIQKTIHKGLDLDWSRQIVAATISNGIRPITGFIIGYPTETEESFNDTLTSFFEFLKVGTVRAHLFTLCPFHEAPMFTEYEHTISRLSQSMDLNLVEHPLKLLENMKAAHRHIFSPNYRYDTPSIDTRWVDASEELSCHLVTLKSLWPLLLKYYSSPLEWYQRWVNWIELYNRQNRSWTRFVNQGNVFNLLNFIEEELVRMEIQDRDIVELVVYEKTKLLARNLDDPIRTKNSEEIALTEDTMITRRCKYLEELFHYDLEELLSGRPSKRLPDNSESWVIFAKTESGYVDTIRISHVTKLLLDIVDQPQSLSHVLSTLSSNYCIDLDSGLRLTRTLFSCGLLVEGKL